MQQSVLSFSKIKFTDISLCHCSSDEDTNGTDSEMISSSGDEISADSDGINTTRFSYSATTSLLACSRKWIKLNNLNTKVYATLDFLPTEVKLPLMTEGTLPPWCWQWEDCLLFCFEHLKKKCWPKNWRSSLAVMGARGKSPFRTSPKTKSWVMQRLSPA
ncbi:hypothetical protein JTE90_018263 [Oedothorax gibbosus]|uniref:Uncharacterized protein n=1 Tax=Oedothorax gibbosus TaxID=931172 RepID=A0AAV6U9Z0_9ARAC|nr:hypothetical protein JTE90_018263 [Oedothorax gibbosus]